MFTWHLIDFKMNHWAGTQTFLIQQIRRFWTRWTTDKTVAIFWATDLKCCSLSPERTSQLQTTYVKHFKQYPVTCLWKFNRWLFGFLFFITVRIPTLYTVLWSQRYRCFLFLPLQHTVADIAVNIKSWRVAM